MSDDPRDTAMMRVMELGGSTCLEQRFFDLDLQTWELDAKIASLDGSDGILEVGRPGVLEAGDAYLGESLGAARAFGATELYQRSDGSLPVFLTEAHRVPDVSEGAPIGYPLARVEVDDGRVVWVVSELFASVPSCEPDEG